ncbi:MAG: chromosome segregation protein SMC [Rhodospirillales bacterium]|nr:chromosome segregation protein SMC [Rhodospirillales bacterium]MCB9964914.1 chromosome segregation protein SMC [Rhodospirillales bacterium]MCB9973708.1 chromosome segregation protein SMC [Rhodospirillales bacterium]
MLHFKSLRLSGFKSFVEKTDLDIGSGLTGIVGPNGCGKSNLVEALRWTMGESSAKKMRGDGMEDVIFAGTEKRPSRNFAEVILTLDNTARTAPAAYNNSEEIHISRKIVRDQGSAYRINGRPARARDVQLLFADTLSGANSPALVSQGKVASIINAKPLQRRLILEESAGISGLYARRHEAEQRLKQAEQNLLRIEDTTGGMETRLNTLKRQARQAARYKNLSQDIRILDLLIAYLEWKAGEDQMISYKRDFQTYETAVAEQMTTVGQLNKTYLTQTQDVPKLREEESRISASLQKHRLDLQRIEDQEERRRQDLKVTTQQQEQTTNDLRHTEKELVEHKDSLIRTDSEQKRIIEEDKNSDAALEDRRKHLEISTTDVREKEEAYNQAMAGAATRNEQKKNLTRQVEQEEQRLKRLEERLASQMTRQKTLEEEMGKFSSLQEDTHRLETLIEQLNTLTQDLQKEEDTKAQLEEQQQEVKAAAQETALSKSRLDSEIKTLEGFIESFSDEGSAPVLNTLSTTPGFEAALSRALGDSLQASLDDSSLSYWKNNNLPETLSLPDQIQCLKDVVKAPEVLHAALSQIGVVEDEPAGHRLHSQLKQGQSLVSREGHYWRWDGFCIKADAPDKQSIFLKQKNRLAELKGQCPAIEEKTTRFEKELSDVAERLQTCKQTLAAKTQDRRTREAERQKLDKDLSLRTARQESLVKEIDALKVTLQDMREEESQVRAALERARQNLAPLSDETSTAEEESALQKLKELLQEARLTHQENISAQERLKQQQNARKARLHALADEKITLQNRIIRGEEHLKNLSKRQTDIAKKLEDLRRPPQDNLPDKDSFLSRIQTLETDRQKVADDLAVKESEAAETARALKEAETALSEARENRARVQALYGAAQDTQNHLVDTIRETFELNPTELLGQIPQVENYTAASLSEKRSARQQLLRDREALGAVNLQAEMEAETLERELGGLLHEKNDLISAIEELRGGIRKLNSEARERLNAAFGHVNAHFQNLFKRLFVGGNAHLSLIESDDPLEAGVEIFAQPPGKALQALSLMSGGEQTMASIALIFAMFLTNPAPICVLDEIDAPLDDANVDKVCDLIEEISETTKTRFLVVTHHRLTMARMHRIYGVTMAEKGVSQLVSLDMQQRFAFLEEAA